MILLYENGLRVDAVLVAIGRNRMRVVLRGCKDASELRLLKDQWMSEEGDGVDIESIFMAGESARLNHARVNAA
jgi:hypothetical protein